VLAEDRDEALEYIYNEPYYKNDEDAEIVEILEVAFETKGVV
jgi:hypothetical protein